MSIETELKKDGIEVLEEVAEITKYTIIRNVTTKIINTFPEYGLDANELLTKFSELKMYRAKREERNERGKLFL